ncbi:MAG: polysaccharide biosynthesis protein [Nitrospirae bacterium]|nr:polysaccharide biosynthesis protein [Nitrospirota bacterium]
MSKISKHIYQFFKDLIVGNRRVAVAIVHLLETALANYLAFMIRLDSITLNGHLGVFLHSLPLLLAIRLSLYIKGGLCRDMWSYSGLRDIVRIIEFMTAGSIIFAVSNTIFTGSAPYPRSVYVIDLLLITIFSGSSRLFITVFKEYLNSRHSGKKILVVGAGDAGVKIAKDIKNNPKSAYHPIGFIDDDPYKKGLVVHGMPIFGPISMIPYVIETFYPDEILVTISSRNNDNIRKIYELSKSYNIPIKRLPGINDIIDGNIASAAKFGQQLINAGLVTEEKVQQALELQKKEGGRLGSKLVKLGYISEDRLVSFLQKQFGISHMKPISVEDLLQREPVRTNIESVRNYIENKSILVTGAGGSIGSELCRQILKYGPSELVMLDRYENGLFGIDVELRAENGNGNGKHRSAVVPVIGDVSDAPTMDHIFSIYRPKLVFHAAAHKHVPLMEYNPVEAVRNNILGTKNLIDITAKYRAESFVMISTDKAVNPSSIMGATKRVAEFLTVMKNSTSGTKFKTVRFGNVLGSSGSVVPLFKEQLSKGGPLTVTHPDMKRFFMLIPEAVQLVLLAASVGNGGEIFVLDMGKPVKIMDLAENVIRLAGFIPDREIKIQCTGLRAGEKMYEELFDKSETMIPSIHEKLRIAVPQPAPTADLDGCIAEFERIVRNYSVDGIVPALQRILPDFNNGKTLNERRQI